MSRFTREGNNNMMRRSWIWGISLLVVILAALALPSLKSDKVPTSSNESGSTGFHLEVEGNPVASAAAATSSADAAYINVVDYGAVGNGKKDDWNGISKAIAKAKALRDKGRQVTLLFPELTEFRSSKAIVIPANISVDQRAPLIYTGTAYVPFLTLGEESTVTGAEYSGLNVRRSKLVDWSKDKSHKAIGIRIINANNSGIHIQRAENFSIGVETIGIGTGFAYNDIRLGKITSNQIGLKVTNKRNKAKVSGWNNENLYTGGNFAVWSGNNTSQSRYGIVITTEDGSYKNNNNNVFVKPSFELNQRNTKGSAESVPIVIEHGLNNTFDYVRNETNGIYMARLKNKSNNNSFNVSYGDAKLDDQSEFGNQIVTTQESSFFDQFTLRESFNLSERWNKSNTAASLDGMSFLSNKGGEPTATNNFDCISSSKGFVTFANGCVAVGAMIDVSVVKQFVIKRAAQNELGGRVIVRGYDKNGKLLSGSGNWLRGMSNNSFYFADTFGGVYMSARDMADPVYFDVKDNVKKVWVGVTAGSGKAVINSFGIFTRSTDYPAVYSGG
ncbi:hypothetical protein SAMN04487969_12072 [Paenibacillus algorifonticola]|uniref:Pectate lyase superfamily protein n=1 Tax=Paenibacillus algorifonticola TaxID=684063 RepID=A0A1I2H6Z8_9BACL|nr:hypothetical protein [Paenibacillus algorifonticola]SFF25328.1 hypothetical protein SAMN04487969_12072 [Paenibacillus algorifonticola]